MGQYNGYKCDNYNQNGLEKQFVDIYLPFFYIAHYKVTVNTDEKVNPINEMLLDSQVMI